MSGLTLFLPFLWDENREHTRDESTSVVISRFWSFFFSSPLQILISSLPHWTAHNLTTIATIIHHLGLSLSSLYEEDPCICKWLSPVISMFEISYNDDDDGDEHSFNSGSCCQWCWRFLFQIFRFLCNSRESSEENMPKINYHNRKMKFLSCQAQCLALPQL